MVGAGRFERPTPCAQGIEALFLASAQVIMILTVTDNHLQSKIARVVVPVAAHFLRVQHLAIIRNDSEKSLGVPAFPSRRAS